MSAWTALDNEIIRSLDLTIYEKVIYAVIKSHMNGSQPAFPGTRKIAQEAGCSKPMVLRSISNLAAKGLLKRERRGKGQLNLYSIPEVVNPIDHSEEGSGQPQIPGGQPQIPGVVNPIDHKKTNRRRLKKKNQEEVRVLTISDTFVQAMIALHQERWGEQGVKEHIEEAVNYYLPEMQKGKYQNLESCVRGSLRRAVEREGRTEQQRPQGATKDYVWPNRRDVSKYYDWPSGRRRE